MKEAKNKAISNKKAEEKQRFFVADIGRVIEAKNIEEAQAKALKVNK